MAFKAQQDKIKGPQLADRLKKLNEKAYNTMINWRFLKTYGEGHASKILEQYFKGEKDITVIDLLEASKGRRPMEVFTGDQSAIDFAAGDLSEDDLFKNWFSESMKQLDQLASERFKSRLGLGEEATNEAAITKKIIQTRIKINPTVESKLRESSR